LVVKDAGLGNAAAEPFNPMALVCGALDGNTSNSGGGNASAVA
jgi:hypothetical protein